jgi:hypothetical protein
VATEGIVQSRIDPWPTRSGQQEMYWTYLSSLEDEVASVPSSVKWRGSQAFLETHGGVRERLLHKTARG